MTKHRQGVRNVHLVRLSQVTRALIASRGSKECGGRCLPGASAGRAAATCPTCIARMRWRSLRRSLALNVEWKRTASSIIEENTEPLQIYTCAVRTGRA